MLLSQVKIKQVLFLLLEKIVAFWLNSVEKMNKQNIYFIIAIIIERSSLLQYWTKSGKKKFGNTKDSASYWLPSPNEFWRLQCVGVRTWFASNAVCVGERWLLRIRFLLIIYSIVNAFFW
jgi:hypothetical protein